MINYLKSFSYLLSNFAFITDFFNKNLIKIVFYINLILLKS